MVFSKRGKYRHYIVHETGIKTILKKKKCKNRKWLSEENGPFMCTKGAYEIQFFSHY